MTVRLISLMAGAALALAACGNVDSSHLVFGQQHNVGLTIAGSGPTQEAEITLGFKDKDIAVVPVAVKNADGTYQRMGADTDTVDGNGTANGGKIQDSFSVLGQFELSSGTSPAPEVGLGKFFATGNAAQTLAQGFADKLAGLANAPK